jgi:hypothetical protein
MTEAFYSVVLDHSAEAVWAVIRPFGHYEWAGVDAETTIEEGKRADQVGAVRHVVIPGRSIRQKLLAHSDRERSYTYSFLEPAPVPNYIATMRDAGRRNRTVFRRLARDLRLRTGGTRPLARPVRAEGFCGLAGGAAPLHGSGRGLVVLRQGTCASEDEVDGLDMRGQPGSCIFDFHL